VKRKKKSARRSEASKPIMPVLTCKHPDHDCPKLLCGYPLPCPWHTVTIDANVTPPTVTIPVTSQMAHARRELAEIGVALHGCR